MALDIYFQPYSFTHLLTSFLYGERFFLFSKSQTKCRRDGLGRSNKHALTPKKQTWRPMYIDQWGNSILTSHLAKLYKEPSCLNLYSPNQSPLMNFPAKADFHLTLKSFFFMKFYIHGKLLREHKSWRSGARSLCSL